MDTVKTMMEIIKRQFLQVMQGDPSFYGQYNIVLSNEQQYVKDKDRNKNNVYIVVKFVPGSLNFGQNFVPVNFNALGEANKLDVCQRLLLEYAQQFNLGEPIEIPQSESGDGSRYIVKQTYTQPQSMSNFTPSWNEFRTLFFMSGNFLIGKNSIPIKSITYYADENSEDGFNVDFLNTSWDFSIQLDIQAFYGTDGRTTSKSKIGTLTFGVVSYLMDNPLCKKIIGIAWNAKALAPGGIKEPFYMTVEFANGTKVEKMKFSLVSVSSHQNIGEFPLMSMSFTN